jgi:hypothetical protein
MPDEKLTHKKVLTIPESILVGAFTGGIEVTANLPLWTFKTRAQCDLSRTYDIRILYRGYTVALGSMVALTTAQIVNTSLTERSLLHQQNSVTTQQRIFSSFMGGALSAVLFGPIDLVGIQYQKHNYSSYAEAVRQTIKKTGGLKGLFIGTPATAITDGIFVGAFYGVYPWMQNYSNLYLENKIYSNVVAAAITGLGASVLSHVPDMVKTMQQFHADESVESKLSNESKQASNTHTSRSYNSKNLVTFFKPNNDKKSINMCLQDLYNKKNGTHLSKAFVPRTIWLTTAVAIAGVTADVTEKTINRRPGSD